MIKLVRHAAPCTTSSRRGIAYAIAALALVPLSACVERTIRVTSDPPGAMVWLNDVEIGPTPAEARFKFHGVYDVRLELDGFESVNEGREAHAPFYEYPGPDLIAAALPVRLHNLIQWHYTLKPAPTLADTGGEATMLERARQLRDRLGPPPQPTATEQGPAPQSPSDTPVEAAPPTFQPSDW